MQYIIVENPLKQDIRGNKRMYVQFPFWQQVNELVAPVWIKYKASGFEIDDNFVLKTIFMVLCRNDQSLGFKSATSTEQFQYLFFKVSIVIRINDRVAKWT